MNKEDSTTTVILTFPGETILQQHHVLYYFIDLYVPNPIVKKNIAIFIKHANLLFKLSKTN